MAAVTKIESNTTSLRVAEEASYKVLPGTPDWIPQEPNSYADFGGQISTVARTPINESRQRKKGVTTDVDASGGFTTDLTQTNIADLLQGFFFASYITKTEFGGASQITNVDGTGEDYEAASGLDAFAAGDLVMASGFTNAANNGVKRIATAAATSLVVETTGQFAANLVDESPPAAAKLVKIGIQGGAGDIDVDVSGALPQLTTTTLDWTAQGLTVGDWIYIGGDAAITKFTNSENNGFARVRTIAANALTLDKAQDTMVVEGSTTETIQIFLGRVLKNRTGTDILRRTYQLERQLGAPDDALPAQIQAEYIEGAVPNEATFNIPQADKATVDLSFVGADVSTIDGPTSLKSGNRPALVESDAFNTSSDVKRIKLSQWVEGDENPTALFAFVTDIVLAINNNINPNKAVGTIGAFEASYGTFEVGGTLTAYFADVAAVAAVRSNATLTFDMHMVKSNTGISFDLPALTLGNSRPTVEQDEPIKLPMDTLAASGAIVNSGLDHTFLMIFWDYLPSAAEA